MLILNILYFLAFINNSEANTCYKGYNQEECKKNPTKEPDCKWLPTYENTTITDTECKDVFAYNFGRSDIHIYKPYIPSQFFECMHREHLMFRMKWDRENLRKSESDRRRYGRKIIIIVLVDKQHLLNLHRNEEKLRTTFLRPPNFVSIIRTDPMVELKKYNLLEISEFATTGVNFQIDLYPDLTRFHPGSLYVPDREQFRNYKHFLYYPTFYMWLCFLPTVSLTDSPDDAKVFVHYDQHLYPDSFISYALQLPHVQHYYLEYYMIEGDKIYPDFKKRMQNHVKSGPPWVDDEHLKKRSLWCRGFRHIMAISEPIVTGAGSLSTSSLKGSRQCSIAVTPNKRVLMMYINPFKFDFLTSGPPHRGDEKTWAFAIEVILNLIDGRWVADSVNLRRLHGKWNYSPSRRRGRHNGYYWPFSLNEATAKFKPERCFEGDKTLYTQERDSLTNRNNEKVEFGRIAVEFDDNGAPYDFTNRFVSREKRESSISFFKGSQLSISRSRFTASENSRSLDSGLSSRQDSSRKEASDRSKKSGLSLSLHRAYSSRLFASSSSSVFAQSRQEASHRSRSFFFASSSNFAFSRKDASDRSKISGLTLSSKNAHLSRVFRSSSQSIVDQSRKDASDRSRSKFAAKSSYVAASRKEASDRSKISGLTLSAKEAHLSQLFRSSSQSIVDHSRKEASDRSRSKFAAESSYVAESRKEASDRSKISGLTLSAKEAHLSRLFRSSSQSVVDKSRTEASYRSRSNFAAKSSHTAGSRKEASDRSKISGLTLSSKEAHLSRLFRSSSLEASKSRDDASKMSKISGLTLSSIKAQSSHLFSLSSSLALYKSRKEASDRSSLEAERSRQRASARSLSKGLQASKERAINEIRLKQNEEDKMLILRQDELFKQRSINRVRELKQRRERYAKVAKNAKLVLVPFAITTAIITLAGTLIHFAWRMRFNLYSNALQYGSRAWRPVERGGARLRQWYRARFDPPAPLTPLQRLALVAQYLGQQTTDLFIYTAQGVAVALVVRLLCHFRKHTTNADTP